MSDYNNFSTKDFLIGSLIGSVVGASVALLFAPKSGREMREEINVGSQEVTRKAGEWKDTLQEKGSEFSETAMSKGNELKDKGLDVSRKIGRAHV